MPKCVICKNEIQRGKRYKSPTHKSIYFCSEECYNKYLVSKNKLSSSLDKLKSYINYLWDEQVNWPYVMRQIKNLKEEYGVDDKDIRLMLKYAIEYEGVKVNPEYGLLQFIQYLQPAKEFAEDILRNKELAESMEDDEIEWVKASRGNGKRWVKGDWEF